MSTRPDDPLPNESWGADQRPRWSEDEEPLRKRRRGTWLATALWLVFMGAWIATSYHGHHGR